jgi:hypothetical protein
MDRDFLSDREGLLHTLELLNRSYHHARPKDLPATLPEGPLIDAQDEFGRELSFTTGEVTESWG